MRPSLNQKFRICCAHAIIMYICTKIRREYRSCQAVNFEPSEVDNKPSLRKTGGPYPDSRPHMFPLIMD